MSKSTFMYAIKVSLPTEDKDASVKQLITDIKNNVPAAGYRQVTNQLKEMGLSINHKRVLRIMRELNLLSSAFNKKKNKYNSYKGKVGTVAVNRYNRRFMTDRPYQKLTTDITEIRWGKQTTNERAYFTCIYDLFSGEVISYAMSSHPTVEFAVNVLKDAIKQIPKCLGYRTTVHSDQGFHYQNKQWVKVLKDNRMFQSMSRKATYLDNAPMESFFHIMKSEVYYQRKFDSLEEVADTITRWIEYYNHTRTKTKLGGKSPINYRILTTQKVA